MDLISKFKVCGKFLIFTVFFGCGLEDSNEVIQTDSELIQCIDTVFSDNYTNRLCKKYYSTGELKEVYSSKNDSILNGPYKTYYKNGKLKDSISYTAGFPYGVYLSFYSNDSLKQVAEYVALEGRISYRNISVRYDSLTGNLDEENSFYHEITLDSNIGKTINEGDSMNVYFNYEIPMYKGETYLEVGNYDEFFSISESDKERVQIIPVVNNKATFKVLVEKRGSYFVRGIIHNYDVEDTTKKRISYFYEKYEVN